MFNFSILIALRHETVVGKEKSKREIEKDLLEMNPVLLQYY